MDLIVIGLNYKNSRLATREKFSLTTKQRHNKLQAIKKDVKVAGGVILSTCNRVELYLSLADSNEKSNLLAKELLYSFADENIDLNKIEAEVYFYKDFEAIRHLYRVSTGLDSLVVGETQILNQLKKAFKEAKSLAVVDNYLYQVFTSSFAVGKRAREETKISQGKSSVSQIAVKLARKVFGCLTGEKVLILGAGKMGGLSLKALLEYGVEGVMVANRTYQRAKKLAKKYSAKVIRWREIDKWLDKTRIVIASTAAPHYVLQKKQLEKKMQQQKGPIFIIDIAVPRDVDPKVAEIPGVHLYTIDDLKDIANENLQQRKQEIKKVNKLIETELKSLQEWLKEEQILPTIKAIRNKGAIIKEKEIQRALNKLENGNDQKKVIESLADRLINKLLHAPTVGIKELADNDTEEPLALVEKLFLGDGSGP